MAVAGYHLLGVMLLYPCAVVLVRFSHLANVTYFHLPDAHHTSGESVFARWSLGVVYTDVSVAYRRSRLSVYLLTCSFMLEK